MKFKYFNSIIGNQVHTYVNLEYILQVYLLEGFIVILNALFLILYSLITSFNCGKWYDNAANAEGFYKLYFIAIIASDGTNMVTSKKGYCGEKRFMASRNAIVVSFFFTTS